MPVPDSLKAAAAGIPLDADWVTAASTAIDALATILIAFAVGAWTWLRWREDRALRMRREIDSLEGDVAFAIHEYGPGRKILAIEMAWENKGRDPIHCRPDPLPEPGGPRNAGRGSPADAGRSGTRIEIHPIPRDLADGAQITERTVRGGSEVFVLRPFGGESFVLEPGTRSLFRDHVVLPGGRDYLVHWRLQGEDADDYWIKERVVSLA